MIKTDKGNVQLEGGIHELMADLSMAVRTMRKAFSERIPVDEAEKLIRKAFENGFLSDDEVREMGKEALKECLNGMDAEKFDGLLKVLADAIRAHMEDESE